MTLELEQIVNGDGSYVEKLETWRVALETIINSLIDTSGVAAGSLSVPSGLREIFDRKGIIGKGSYDFATGTKTGPNYYLAVAAGAAWVTTGYFYKSGVSVNVSLLPFATGTLYLNLQGLGVPAVSTSPDGSTIYQFSWNATSHEVTNKALYTGVAILFDGDEYADLLTSAVRAKTFTSVADRLEEIEAILGSSVQTPASADTINVNCALGGSIRILLNRATTTINFSGAYDGQPIRLELIQDATGGRAVAFGAMVKAGTDFTLPAALSAAPDARDFLGFLFSDDNDKYNFVSLARGY